MASTQLSDIFVADYYGTLEPVNSPEKTAVYESGIITRSPTLDDIAKNGQGTSEISYWQDLDADEAPNISNDNPDDQGEVGKAQQGSMRARTLYLNKGYGVSDLTSELANSEPMQHIRIREAYQRQGISVSEIEEGLRLDGPSIAQWVEEGYKASTYPPAGYAATSTAAEIAKALEEEGDGGPENDPHKMKVSELKEWLTAQGINFDPALSKSELQVLIPSKE